MVVLDDDGLIRLCDEHSLECDFDHFSSFVRGCM
jgi:hypothetical protein